MRFATYGDATQFQLDELEKKLEKLQNEHVQLKAEKSEEFVVLTPTDAVESFTELKV